VRTRGQRREIRDDIHEAFLRFACAIKACAVKGGHAGKKGGGHA
jgi:hypothetical protein